MILENIMINNKDKIFAIDSYANRMYTYFDIYNLSMYYSKIFFSRYNINSSNRVILLLDNSVEFISIYFWAFFNHITIMPLSKKLPKEDVEKIIIDYNIDFIITDENLMHSNKEINIKDFDIDKEIYDLRDMPKINYDENLLLMYSSGTTSKPKCIVHSISSFVENGSKFIEFHEVTEKDRFILLLEMSYMAGYYNMFIVPFLAQASVVIKQSFKPQDILRFWNEIIEYKVNILWLVPTIIKLLNKLDRNIKGKEYCLNHIRYIFSCTAPLDLKDKIYFRNKYSKKVFNTYGLSETLFISSENKNNYQEVSNYAGERISRVIIKDDEICVYNDNTFKGYLTSKGEITKHKNKIFLTGDLGKISNNSLYITGRKKDIIIKGGVNINPNILENKINTLNFVVDVAVVGIKDEIFGEKAVAAVVVIKDKPEIDYIKELQFFSKYNFASDIQVDDFIIFESLPLNINNKVSKKDIIQIIEKRDL